MNWGFIGFGNIAPKFLKSLRAFENEKIVAVATKSGKQQALNLCPEAKIYGNYIDLAADPDVDIVYISTTHNFHIQHVLMCLQYKKHVICEKPMSLDAAGIQEIMDFPRTTFLMEAMWTRFLPAYEKTKSLIHEGLIGDLHWLTANFAFDYPGKPEGRHLNPALAGGALYDIGIYPLALALDLANHEYPAKKTAMAKFSDQGVDINIAFDFAFPNGFIAQLFCALDKNGSNDAIITGSKGILIMKDFWKCQKIVHVSNEETYTYYLPFNETGYYHEIAEAINCIKDGKLESPRISLKQSSMISSLMEDLLSLSKTQI